MSEQTQEKVITEEQLEQNPALEAVVYANNEETELKKLLVDYTGNKLDEENVTVNMIAEVLAADFPEFTYAFAEENFIRGYKVGIEDAIKLSTEQAQEKSTTSE